MSRDEAMNGSDGPWIPRSAGHLCVVRLWRAHDKEGFGV